MYTTEQARGGFRKKKHIAGLQGNLATRQQTNTAWRRPRTNTPVQPATPSIRVQ